MGSGVDLGGVILVRDALLEGGLVLLREQSAVQTVRVGHGPEVEMGEVRARSRRVEHHGDTRTPERTSKREGYDNPRVGHDREAEYGSMRWM